MTRTRLPSRLNVALLTSSPGARSAVSFPARVSQTVVPFCSPAAMTVPVRSKARLLTAPSVVGRNVRVYALPSNTVTARVVPTATSRPSGAAATARLNGAARNSVLAPVAGFEMRTWPRTSTVSTRSGLRTN